MQRHEEQSQVGEEPQIQENCCQLSQYLFEPKKRQTRNKVLLKIFLKTSAVISNPNAEEIGNFQNDEFTLSSRTFEASYADGSRVFFRRDCYHRLLTVSTGSSVVINDAPYLNHDGATSPRPTYNAASSLSAAFTSCNGNGLAWLSPEARIIYSKALEMLSHCEKLEATLLLYSSQNTHFKLPVIIGRITKNLSGTISSHNPTVTESRYHPFHAFTCPYCICCSSQIFTSSSNYIGSVTFSLKGSSLEPGAVIEVASSKVDISSSGIASKSASPPNLKDMISRNPKVKRSENQASIPSSVDDTSNRESRVQKLAACRCGRKSRTVKKSKNGSIDRSMTSNKRQKSIRKFPSGNYLHSNTSAEWLEEAVSKLSISKTRKTNGKHDNNCSYLSKASKSKKTSHTHCPNIKRKIFTSGVPSNFKSTLQECQQTNTIAEYTGTPVSVTSNICRKIAKPIRLYEEDIVESFDEIIEFDSS